MFYDVNILLCKSAKLAHPFLFGFLHRTAVGYYGRRNLGPLGIEPRAIEGFVYIAFRPPTVRVFLISVFPVHSTSFFTSPLRT